MLHFLAAVALCLFIGERLVRYWRAWKLRRDERRCYRAMLYPPPSEPQPNDGWRWIVFPLLVCLVMGGSAALLVATTATH